MGYCGTWVYPRIVYTHCSVYSFMGYWVGYLGVYLLFSPLYTVHTQCTVSSSGLASVTKVPVCSTGVYSVQRTVSSSGLASVTG